MVLKVELSNIKCYPLVNWHSWLEYPYFFLIGSMHRLNPGPPFSSQRAVRWSTTHTQDAKSAPGDEDFLASWVGLHSRKLTAFLGPKMMVALEKVTGPFKHGIFWYQLVRFLGCSLIDGRCEKKEPSSSYQQHYHPDELLSWCHVSLLMLGRTCPHFDGIKLYHLERPLAYRIGDLPYSLR